MPTPCSFPEQRIGDPYLEGAGAGVAKSGKKVRGAESEPNPMARLNVWGWAVVEVAKMRRLVFSGVPSLMVGEQLPQKQQGSRRGGNVTSSAPSFGPGLTFKWPSIILISVLRPATSALYVQLCLRKGFDL